MLFSNTIQLPLAFQSDMPIAMFCSYSSSVVAVAIRLKMGSVWGAVLKTMKLCFCLLLLSMLALLHYTLKQTDNSLVGLDLGEEVQEFTGSLELWREGRAQRVLASTTPQNTAEYRATNGRTETQTQAATSATVPVAPTRLRPLPHLHLQSILNESAPLPPLTNDTHLPHQPGYNLSTGEEPSPDDVLSPRSPSGGYVVVLRVYEQQTMASGNLLQLQCWASMLNLSVVAPFMKLSQMVTPLDEARHSSHLSLWDTFSRDHWERHTEAHGYLPLVDWGQWVRQAPRKLIAVQFKYPLLSQVKKKEKELKLHFPHPLTGDDYSEGCEFKFLSGKALKFIKSKGFAIVRKVCFNFFNGDGFTFSQFRDHIFGGYDPRDTSVMMDMWRGLGEPQRVLITDKICRERHPFREQVQPSLRLVADTQTYKDKFLGPQEYIAVITRFEMTGLTRQYELRNDTHAEIPRCIRKTLYQLLQLRKDTGIQNTFVSADIGKYGSLSFAKKKYYGHLNDMVEFVRVASGGKMALADIERTLEVVSHTADSGYIASLQQLIVTRAKCILFMGGGSFQRHALHVYQDLHPHKQDRCIHVVESCTNPNRPIR